MRSFIKAASHIKARKPTYLEIKHLEKPSHNSYLPELNKLANSPCECTATIYDVTVNEWFLQCYCGVLNDTWLLCVKSPFHWFSSREDRVCKGLQWTSWQFEFVWMQWQMYATCTWWTSLFLMCFLHLLLPDQYWSSYFCSLFQNPQVSRAR